MSDEIATEQWKRLFENEGVSPSDLALLFDVPRSRISEWLKRRSESTATIVLWTWEECGQKFGPMQRLKSGVFSSDQTPVAENPKMYVGIGLWGALNLFRIRNRFLSDSA